MKLKNETYALAERFEAPEEELHELREASKRWTPEQWEAHLKTLEISRFESVIPSGRYDEVTENMEESIFDNAQRSSKTHLIERVQSLLSQVTPRQKQVLEEIYLKGKSPRQAALALGVCRSVALRLQRRALRNLRRYLAQGGSTLPLVEGLVKKQGRGSA